MKAWLKLLAPGLQSQGPEFQLQYCQKKKKNTAKSQALLGGFRSLGAWPEDCGTPVSFSFSHSGYEVTFPP
jgi:hypothetical protein